MIVPSPILLIAAAQATAHDDVVRPRLQLRHDGTRDSTGVPFVQHAGYWAHFDPRVGCSSWPFHPDWQLAEIVRFVAKQELLHLDGAIGDLLLSCDDRGRPARLGIVVSPVHHRHWRSGELSWRCDVLCGTTGEAGVVSGAWYRESRGDRLVPWHLSRHWATPVDRRVA